MAKERRIESGSMLNRNCLIRIKFHKHNFKFYADQLLTNFDVDCAAQTEHCIKFNPISMWIIIVEI